MMSRAAMILDGEVPKCRVKTTPEIHKFGFVEGSRANFIRVLRMWNGTSFGFDDVAFHSGYRLMEA